MSRHYEITTSYDHSVGALRIQLRGTLPNGATFTGDRVIDSIAHSAEMTEALAAKHKHDLEQSFSDCYNKLVSEAA